MDDQPQLESMNSQGLQDGDAEAEKSIYLRMDGAIDEEVLRLKMAVKNSQGLNYIGFA